MKTKQELLSDIAKCKDQLNIAEAALDTFLSLPENNQFEDLPRALQIIEITLRGKASDDCEGSYNCGLKQYTRLFMVNGETYQGVLDCEYNRHDKTYYYLEEANFTYSKQ